ncbi:MAG: hypothetical protein N2C14_32690, partial [Planctomycetales bacterium]
MSWWSSVILVSVVVATPWIAHAQTAAWTPRRPAVRTASSSFHPRDAIQSTGHEESPRFPDGPSPFFSKGSWKGKTGFSDAGPFDPAPPSPPAPLSKPSARLTLADVESMALARNPSLTEATAQISALRGKWIQVGLQPNPVVGYLGGEIGNEGHGGQQ